jgi:transcriptional regulator with XRE-family HTH domain
MVTKVEHQRPGQVFAARVKEARQENGWTQQQLVDRLAELGYRISRPTLLRIEGGGTRSEKATLQELLALAAALGVHPLDLLAPSDDAQAVAITPRLVFAAPLAHEWLQGSLLLPMTAGVDIGAISDEELARLLERELARGMTASGRRHMKVKELAAAGVAEIRAFRKEARS